jgi:hypothetical protein
MRNQQPRHHQRKNDMQAKTGTARKTCYSTRLLNVLAGRGLRSSTASLNPSNGQYLVIVVTNDKESAVNFEINGITTVYGDNGTRKSGDLGLWPCSSG